MDVVRLGAIPSSIEEPYLLLCLGVTIGGTQGHYVVQGLCTRVSHMQSRCLKASNATSLAII